MDINPNNNLFTIDDYGRMLLLDPALIELVNGAADIPLKDDNNSCNNGCGSNTACYNSGCR